jgi:hypothetical protein
VTSSSIVDEQGAAQILGMTATWDQWYIVNVHLDRALSGRITATAANLSTLLVTLGVGVAVAACLAKRATDRVMRWRSGGLLIALVAPAILTIRHAIPLFEYYFLFVLPAAALLVGGGIHWLCLRAGTWQRGALGLVLSGVIVAVSIQALIVTRMLDHLAANYEPSYGAPLVTSEALARDMVAFGVETGSERAVVEQPSPESGALAYLVRPAFPSIELSNFGQVGLGFPLRSGARSEDMRAWAGELGPPQRVDLRYVDGVQVLFATASRQLLPGQWIHLAASWQADDLRSPLDVVWEVALHDAAGLVHARRVGIRHTSTSIPLGERTLSWFSLETEPGAPEGKYELGLQRVDSTTGAPMAFVDSTGQTALEWRSAVAWRPR